MERLGPFELVRGIAIGGMAEVHLAKVTGYGGFEKYVALKTIHPNYVEDDDFISMLIDEAKLAVQLVHPNIAQTFDLGRVGDTYYMSMEYIDGIDLAALLRAAERQNMRLPFEAAAYISRDVAAALDHAHSRCDPRGRPLGIVHRDVSPTNVMVSYEGLVKLVDFGIAKAASSVQRTNAGIIKGKLSYLSPEQALTQPLDGRSDIYAAGIVLYEMITGRPVHEHEDIEELIHLTRAGWVQPPHELRPDVPEELERIVLRALAPSPDDRYQQAGDLMIDLQRFLGQYARRYVAADLAALVNDLSSHRKKADPRELDAQISEIFERIDIGDIAHGGDSMFDENSIVMPKAELEEELEEVPRFGAYTLHEQLFESRLLTTHRVTVDGSGRELELKRFVSELAHHPEFPSQFNEELTRATRIHHPNLVEIVATGVHERVHYVVTELIRGLDLRRVLARQQPAPIAIALSLVGQLLDALVEIHHDGGVHGGLTPANLLVTPGGILKIVEHGTARALRGIVPPPLRTVPYLGPEAIDDGVADARGDVFGVAIIAWELITGRSLFDTSSRHTVVEQLRILDIAPPSTYNESCDPILDRVILAALSRFPNTRPSAAALRAELAEVAQMAGYDEITLGEVAAWVHA
ncbi:MAG: serine/threonine-protein kinase [Kofleriaceae bacterium]|nr:serine/threonine-protein kinase [Kofleriaceae bacterium]